jgi:hypothetical protein
MENRIQQVLAGKHDNYLLPFLWQRGESEDAIRTEMAKVAESGIRAVCVEARPHPDFVGPRWWHDMDIIMEEARARGMRVWILDDDHFPTGHAAGKVEGAPLELRRLFLREFHVDAFGPQKNAAFIVKPWFGGWGPDQDREGTQLLAAVAYHRSETDTLLGGECIDLTDRVQGETLFWDVPKGVWRLFFVYATPTGGSEHHVTYLNPLVAESTRILLDAVYEPFYQHYPDDFGKTLAGFFSDEPGFYNDNEHGYYSLPGIPNVALPWRPGLLERLETEGGTDFRTHLPLLWYDAADETSAAASGVSATATRFIYMDVVTRLYGENFTNPLGDWCRAHQVEYIGHIIEDNGAHAHLGVGAGHYFRSLWGQDMAGLDVVLWQIVPGMDRGMFAAATGECNGEFFHYGLAKMASSLGHIDPKKHGRTMCEIFGAYGWREGLKLEKWLTDHMLVRGVNYFVPHAFSQAEFPDPDCPPHMYARGKNPQYRYYHLLNDYTNRICHLLSSGTHVAPAAVLYQAEAEWSGAYMPFEKPVRVLMQRQIDCDVLPYDVLVSTAQVSEGCLSVEAETYRALVLPASEALPAKLLARLLEMADQGLPLFFVERIPTRASEGEAETTVTVLERLKTHANVKVVGLEELPAAFKALNYAGVQVERFCPSLRVYHTRSAGMDAFLFVNEHPNDTVETHLTIPARGPAIFYDAMENVACRLAAEETAGGLRFGLKLEAYQSILILAGPDTAAAAVSARPVAEEAGKAAFTLEIHGPWRVSTASSEQYPNFTLWKDAVLLGDLSRPELLPDFSGTFRYECEFDAPQAGVFACLDLGEVYETAEAWLNGEPLGVRICPPYRLEIAGAVRAGKNRLVIEVTNTLVRDQRDYLSRFAAMEPSGLLGPVVLK